MPTVLVVDDEPTIRDVVVRYLRRDGYTTLEAGNGDEACALVERASPNLVVLDLMLPGMDGLALCRWIRERSTLPVIVLTARGEEADRIVGLELGADDYVTKPFSPRELVARVHTVLRRAPSAPSASAETVAFGTIEIDAAARQVRKRGLSPSTCAGCARRSRTNRPDRVTSKRSGAVLLSGVAMFHMGADVVILAVTAASSTVAVAVALSVAHSIISPIERLRHASSRLAAGELSVRAPDVGPVELAELGASFNCSNSRGSTPTR